MDIKSKKCFIFDLDGTVYMGDVPIQGTIDFIKKNIRKLHIYFMTNNTSKTPDEYITRLGKFGIEVTPDQIISPFIPLFKYFTEYQLKYIFLLANKKVEEYIQRKFPDIEFTDQFEKCEAIVLTFDTDLTYVKLKTASLILQNKPKVKYVATHPDNVCPTNQGNIPDVGGFIKLLEITTGRIPEKVFGKPNVELINKIKTVYKEDEIAIVGDRIYTDMKLAENANVDFILVLSGETTIDDIKNLKIAPAYIVTNMGIFNS